MNRADTLRAVALVSIRIPLDRNTGTRLGDPLNDLVTEETWRDWLEIAETITGREIGRGRGNGIMAARVRATVRRWAARQ